MLLGQLCLPTQYSIASYVSLLSGQLIKSDILVYLLRLNFKFRYFPGWVGGWLGGVKLKLKLNSAQLKLELGLSLATMLLIVVTPLLQRGRAAHSLHLDQLINFSL